MIRIIVKTVGIAPDGSHIEPSYKTVDINNLELEIALAPASSWCSPSVIGAEVLPTALNSLLQKPEPMPSMGLSRWPGAQANTTPGPIGLGGNGNGETDEGRKGPPSGPTVMSV